MTEKIQNEELAVLSGQGVIGPIGGNSPTSAAAASNKRSPSPNGGIRSTLRQYLVVFLLPIFFGLFSVLAPTTFFTFSSVRTILTTNAALLVLGIGQTVVLASGEFDLSFGGILGLAAAVVVFTMTRYGLSSTEAIMLSLAVALLLGIANAFFIIYLRVKSFIVTLGMGTLTTGMGLGLTNSQTIPNLSKAITTFTQGKILGVGLPFYYSLGLVILLWFVFEYTRVGRHIYFVGEGRHAAYMAGIAVNRIRTGALISSSLLAWLAGMIMLGQTAAVDATYGGSFLLPVFAAVFLGYTTIRVSRFNAIGTFVGALVLAIGTTGLELLNVASWVTQIFSGGILIVAVALANIFGSVNEADAE